MRGIPWRLLGLALSTAVLLDLPFPIAGPMPAWRSVFAWFALVPLVWGLVGLARLYPDRRRRWRLGWSMLAGWLAGALWFGANCYWVYDTMHLYGGMGPAMALVALVAFSLYLGFWFGMFGLAMGLIGVASEGKPYAWVRLAAVPFFWAAMEFALDRIPMFPWDLLGYSQVDNGLLMRLAPWTGVYGISFVLAGGNALLLSSIVLKPKRWVWQEIPISRGDLLWGVWLAIVIACLADFRNSSPIAPTEATAVLVQPNLDVASDDVWQEAEWDRQVAQFGRLGAKACGSYLAGMPADGVLKAEIPCDAAGGQVPALIAWPESPAPFRELDPKFKSAMAQIARGDQTPLIVGDVGMEEDDATQETRIYNSASVVGMDGRFVGRYDKIHLVPFGEYVPFRRALFFIRQVTQTMTDMSAGTERKTFRLNGHRYGIFICYESVFGDEVRQYVRLGSEVLVNISDDGWYGDTSAPWQHLNMARMRANENRRWILRDTNNGVTAAIDPYGVVRQSIPRHQVGALAAQFGYGSEITFYTEHGDWVGVVCGILSLALLLWSVRSLLGSLRTNFGRG